MTDMQKLNRVHDILQSRAAALRKFVKIGGGTRSDRALTRGIEELEFALLVIQREQNGTET